MKDEITYDKNKGPKCKQYKYKFLLFQHFNIISFNKSLQEIQTHNLWFTSPMLQVCSSPVITSWGGDRIATVPPIVKTVYLLRIITQMK